ncbi:MAG: hypothetical protein AAF460_15015 [Pseudomonadota bacterium]
MTRFHTFGLASLLLAGTASAGELNVTVVDRLTGFPVEGASVCLGTQQDTALFAGARTNADGIARLQAPVWAHRLSISRGGYANVDIEQPARRFDLQLELDMQPGRAAPTCLVNPSSLSPRAGIEITGVDVLLSDKDSGRVEIQTHTSGYAPTHVRVASRDDFAGSSWQVIDNGRSVHYVRNLDDAVYVQARRRVGDDQNHIESVSTIVNEAL